MDASCCASLQDKIHHTMSYFTKEQHDALKKTQLKLRALEHPLREKMLEVIKSNNNRMNVTDIYVQLRIEQSIASQMLGILRNEGFVLTEREGKTVWYSVDDAAIAQVVTLCEAGVKNETLVNELQ